MGYMICAVFAISITAGLSELVRPPPYVSHYEVVRPVKLSSRHKRSTSKQDGAMKRYPEELQYQLHLDGRNHTVYLEKNRLLMGSNYSETHYNQDGTRVTTFPNFEDHCYYHGHIKDMEDSSVSVGVCTGISGFLRAAQEVYLIEPLGDSPEGDHAVYKPQHLSGQTVACGLSNSTEDDSAFIQPRAAGVFRPSGQQNKPHFSTSRYVELYMVVDNAEFHSFGTFENVRKRIQDVVNHVDLYYRALNIRVLLVGLEVWTDKDKFEVHGSEDETLSRFLAWRLNDLVKRARHDSAMFVTGIDFFGDTVGLATTYAMCSEKSAAVNQDYHRDALALAATVAHEMGHTLGMSHDEPGCSCGPTERNCLMVGTVEKHAFTFPKLFSDCSLKQLSVFLESPAVDCLLDAPKPDSLYGGAVCGNGVVDTGEQCDCGPVEMCENPCCDPSTCRLTTGSQCAEGQCCEKCQLKQPGTVCRPAAHECDLAEYCDGSSETCPEDSFKMNGAECNYGDGYCYNGMCPSASGHCKKIWGPGARSPPECFHLNMKGVEEAHCGISGRTYKRCSFRDMVCGKLFCSGGNKDPFIGWPGYWSDPQCYYVRDSRDPHGLGMVPTGTKCGLNKVCYNHMCQNVTVYGNEGCEKKCNNHGECNHKGECHCEPGWAPPDCSMRVHTNHGTGNNAVIIGVSAAGAVLLLLALLVVAARLQKKRKATKFCKQKPQSGKLTPSYHKDQASDSQLTQPLQISQPVFLETTSKRMDDPTVIMVMPSRPPPSPPKSSPRPPSQRHNTQMRPIPPTKPSPAVPTKLAHKPMSPPVPPVKPGVRNSEWNHTQSGTAKPALRPPTLPR